jgi:hypothetical protein
MPVRKYTEAVTKGQQNFRGVGTHKTMACRSPVLPEIENAVTIFQEVDDFCIAEHL